MSPSFSAELLRDFGCYELLNSLSEGAYITDADRKILFWNRAAEAITGWPAREVVGSNCRDNILIHTDKDGHELCKHDHCPLYRSIVTDHPSFQPLLVYAQSKSGKRVPVEVTVAPIHDAAGAVVGGIELFRDMTPAVADILRAKAIQQTCLECALAPDDRVRFDVRYTPSQIVGGDFYRIERTEADQYAILVADVMGHGMAAALYTTQLRSMWEDLRGELGSPGAFMTGLSQRLRVLTREAGYFATAVYAKLNAMDGSLTYVCAGHPQPLVAHADGNVERYADGQPALGMFEGVEYAETFRRLDRGDTLLLFTDGATEIADAADEYLGAAGLMRLVRENVSSGGGAGVDLPRLEEQLLRYSRRVRLEDDLTLLAVRWA
jgi:PAS domain S-box-containing protein